MAQKIGFIGSDRNPWWQVIVKRAPPGTPFVFCLATLGEVRLQKAGTYGLVIVDWNRNEGHHDETNARVIATIRDLGIPVAVLDCDPVRQAVRKSATSAGACHVFARIFDAAAVHDLIPKLVAGQSTLARANNGFKGGGRRAQNLVRGT